MPVIKLVPFQCRCSHFYEPLAQHIQKTIGWKVEIIDINFDHLFALNPDRNQYHSSEILLGLKNIFMPSKDKILAVTDLDLFIPILTFVFGEAQLDGPTAVISTFRLRPEFYGLPPNKNLVMQRLIKEAIHELGHTFGLVHCLNQGCVLNASTYVEEIDLKEADFCPECAQLLAGP